MKFILWSVLLLILLGGCAAEFPETESLQDTIPEEVPLEEIPAVKEAAVTINNLTCIPSPPPSDSAYCPNCNYYKVDWNGTAQGPIGTSIYPDTNLGYKHRTADCGAWLTNLNTNCLRKENQPFATMFAGGMDYVEVQEKFEFILLMILNAPGFDPVEVEKSVICS